MTPDAWTLRRKISPYRPSATTPSWMRAPPESLMPMTGQPIFIARSMTLTIFSPNDLAERAAEDGEVLGEDARPAAVDRAVAGDDAVAVGAVAAPAEAVRAVPGVLVELDEDALVEQHARCARGRSSCPWRAASRRPGPTGVGRLVVAALRSASLPAVVCRSAESELRTSVSVVGAASAMAGSLALSSCANPWTSRPCGRRWSRPAAWRASTATRRSAPPTCEAARRAGALARRGADHQSAGRGRLARPGRRRRRAVGGRVGRRPDGRARSGAGCRC